MTYILEIGDRRRLKRVSTFSPHRPSGTLLRWEAQFRRGTARNQCSALTVRGRHAVIQEREAKETVHPCCKYCRKAKACGNSCIKRTHPCHQAAGCACDAH